MTTSEPVMYLPSSEAMNATAAATVLGLGERCRQRIHEDRPERRICLHGGDQGLVEPIGVATAFGIRIMTRMSYCPSSLASVFAIPEIACLEAT